MRHKLNYLQKSIIAMELPSSNNCLLLKKRSAIFFPQWQVLLVIVISTYNTFVSVFTIDITLHNIFPIFFFPHSPFVHSKYRFMKVFHHQQARKQGSILMTSHTDKVRLQLSAQGPRRCCSGSFANR